MFLVKVIVKKFITKERYGSRKTKKCKRCDHKIKLVEGIKKNIQQSNFKVSGLALYCYCGDTVKYGLLSLSLSKKMSQRKVTTWRLRKLQCHNKLL